MAGKGESASSKRKIEAREREAMVLRLRRAGATFAQIAEEVGYAGEGAAYKAFARAMDRTIREPAESYRNLHRDRLEELYRLTMGQILAEDAAGRSVARLVEVANKVLDSLAKLDGLDAPRKIENVTPFLDEARRIAGELGLDEAEAVEVAQGIIREAANAK